MAVKMNRIRFSLRSFLAFFLLISTYIAFQASITSDEPIVKDILRHSKPSGPSIAIVDETSPSMLRKLFFYRKRYREIVIVGGELEPWLCEKIGKLKHIESVFIDSCRLHSVCLPKSVKNLEIVNADGLWLEATINSLARLETVRCSSRINAPAQGGRLAGWSLWVDLRFSQSFPNRFSNGVLDFLLFRSLLKQAVRDRLRSLCCTECGHWMSVFGFPRI